MILRGILRVLQETSSRYRMSLPMTDPRSVALIELLERHFTPLVLWARSWCAAPEDAVQEAFLCLLHERRWPTNPRAWLFQVVRNVARQAGRAAARRVRRESQVAQRESAWFIDAQDQQLDAQEATTRLATLPEPQREVVIARLWGGLSFEEIGQIVGCPTSTAHHRYQSALAALRASWPDEEQPQSMVSSARISPLPTASHEETP